MRFAAAAGTTPGNFPCLLRKNPGKNVCRKGDVMGREWKIFGALVAIFVVAYTLPLKNPKIQAAIQESFCLLQWYARNHTLSCVVPALFIAGAIITFLSQNSVMRYLGPKAKQVLAYAVASVWRWFGTSRGLLVFGYCYQHPCHLPEREGAGLSHWIGTNCGRYNFCRCDRYSYGIHISQGRT